MPGPQQRTWELNQHTTSVPCNNTHLLPGEAGDEAEEILADLCQEAQRV